MSLSRSVYLTHTAINDTLQYHISPKIFVYQADATFKNYTIRVSDLTLVCMNALKLTVYMYVILFRSNQVICN